MVTRMLAAGQEDEEIRNSGILYLNEQDEKGSYSSLSISSRGENL
jgi:hypothetical protein